MAQKNGNTMSLVRASSEYGGWDAASIFGGGETTAQNQPSPMSQKLRVKEAVDDLISSKPVDRTTGGAKIKPQHQLQARDVEVFEPITGHKPVDFVAPVRRPAPAGRVLVADPSQQQSHAPAQVSPEKSVVVNASPKKLSVTIPESPKARALGFGDRHSPVRETLRSPESSSSSSSMGSLPNHRDSLASLSPAKKTPILGQTKNLMSPVTSPKFKSAVLENNLERLLDSLDTNSLETLSSSRRSKDSMSASVLSDGLDEIVVESPSVREKVKKLAQDSKVAARTVQVVSTNNKPKLGRLSKFLGIESESEPVSLMLPSSQCKHNF
jgi:hypothetical protein